MVRRALLIGSTTGGLLGVESDVHAMHEALDGLGFEVAECTSRDATRTGIVDAYDRLISQIGAGDGALVYYSGHGGRTLPGGEAGRNVDAARQFLVPVDFEQSTDDDFRGILDIELSSLLARLTARTRNATVVLDCCHSARMSRDASMMPRAWPRPWSTGVAAHVARLAREGLDTQVMHVESNPNAVRLVACGPTESAFEYTNREGSRVGLFTESLVFALRQARGALVTWTEVMDLVRGRVLEMAPGQRPEAEGPATRFLFALDEPERMGVLGLARDQGAIVLTGGRIHGVACDDEYLIMPAGSVAADESKALGLARVTAVHAATSEVSVDPAAGAVEGARAFPRHVSTRRRPVRLDAAQPIGATIVDALSGSQLVRPANADDREVLATLVVDGPTLTLADPSGRPLLAPAPLRDGSIPQAVRNLEAFARADTLRALRGGEGAARLEDEFAIAWGRVEDRQGRPLAMVGETLFEGERFYARLENHSHVKLWFSVFDVGLAGRVSLLSASAPSGIEVGPGQSYVLGQRQGLPLEGLQLYWPDLVPRDGPRLEALVVFVMDGPEDLGSLQQLGMRGKGGGQLRQLVQQLGFGGTRDAPPEQPSVDERRYAVEHIEFLLSPGPAPVRESAEFLRDDRPHVSMRTLAPRALSPPPATIAVRLVEAVVHRNRAVFGASIRVDTMVLTGGSKPDDCYRVQTVRFPKVKDGDRLPLDNLLLYLGPVQGFIDLALWVSRDAGESLALSELLANQLNDTEVQGALAALAGLVLAAAPAAAAVAAVGAVGTLVNVGYRLLVAATGASIGVYRTSLLPHEQFGVGRHPPSGTLRAQDFSLAFEIVPGPI